MWYTESMVQIDTNAVRKHNKPAAARKTGRIQVLFTPGELERIKSRAAKKGMSVSQFAHDVMMKSLAPKRAASRNARAGRSAAS